MGPDSCLASGACIENEASKRACVLVRYSPASPRDTRAQIYGDVLYVTLKLCPWLPANVIFARHSHTYISFPPGGPLAHPHPVLLSQYGDYSIFLLALAPVYLSNQRLSSLVLLFLLFYLHRFHRWTSHVAATVSPFLLYTPVTPLQNSNSKIEQLCLSRLD